jgi:hypothetical protein
LDEESKRIIRYLMGEQLGVDVMIYPSDDDDLNWKERPCA